MFDKAFLISLFFIVLCNSAYAQQTTNACAISSCEIGAMVDNIEAALQSPNKTQSLQTIILYGRDSRHQKMIRGWLFQELVVNERHLHNSRKELQQAELQQKSNFLKQAIIAIDLE